MSSSTPTIAEIVSTVKNLIAASRGKGRRKSARTKIGRTFGRDSDRVIIDVRKPKGVTVTVTIADAPKRVPTQDELVSHPKRDAVRFENNPYALAYRRPRTDYIPRVGRRRA